MDAMQDNKSEDSNMSEALEKGEIPPIVIKHLKHKRLQCCDLFENNAEGRGASKLYKKKQRRVFNLMTMTHMIMKKGRRKMEMAIEMKE